MSADAARRGGVSIWTIAEPLLRLRDDNRARLALAQLDDAGDAGAPAASAASMLERNRVALLLRAAGTLDAG